MPAGSRRNEEAALAAARLRHDLGKAVRFSAPESLERDTEELRARLGRDVAAIRTGPGGSAAAIFDAWRTAFAHLFREAPGAVSLLRLERAMEETRALSGRLAGLSRRELERLDALTREVAGECRELVAASRTPEGA